VSGLCLAFVLLATRGDAQEASKAEAFFGKEELSRQAQAHEKGCKKGDAGECFNLALVYQQGLGGVTKNEALAATFFQKACDKGHLDACNNLGIAYAEGQGVPRDPKLAVAFFDKSCKANDANASLVLAALPYERSLPWTSSSCLSSLRRAFFPALRGLS
jgi:TPR repeat protein